MSTEPRSTDGSVSRINLRLLSTIAVILTMAWGIGWIWVGGTGAEQYYLWIGAPVIALMWVAIGWANQQRERA